MLIISILFFLQGNFSQCKENEQSYFNNDQYKYYTGRGSSSKSSAEAAKIAEEDARTKAVKDNFGSSFRVHQTNYIDLQQSISDTRTEESSQYVYLKGFERIKEKVERNSSGVYEVQIDFRYSIVEIGNEKKRLANLTSEDLLNESGSTKCPHNKDTKLVLTTSQPNAVVMLDDGEVLGKTPLKVSCQLPAGEPVKIILDHPHFELKTETILINSGQILQVNSNLVPASTKVSFITEPSDAEVYVDGNFIGNTPIELENITVGRKHQVVFSHRETEKLAFEFEVPRQSGVIRKEYSLPYKAAFFSLKVNPADSDIYNKNTYINRSSTGQYPCDPKNKEVEIKINKEGFLPEIIRFQCVGGKTIRLGKIELKKMEMTNSNTQSVGDEISKVSLDVELIGQGLPLADLPGLQSSSKIGVGWSMVFSYRPIERLSVGLLLNSISYSDDNSSILGPPNTSAQVLRSITFLQAGLITSVNIWGSFGIYAEYGFVDAKLNLEGYNFNSSGQGTPSGSDSKQSINSQNYYGSGLSFSDSQAGFSFVGKVGFRSYSFDMLDDRIVPFTSIGLRYGF
jgi:hypothetical protein